MAPREIARRIEERLAGSLARVEGADAHYTALVVAPVFEGKTRVEQHRMIYDLFREEMAREEIHALALTTRTPSEWEKERPPNEE